MPNSRIFSLGCLVWLTILSIGQAQTDRPEVLLVRGGAGYWPGLRAIANDLSNHGFEPRTTFGSLYALEAADIAAQYHSGRRKGPITIVGYSSGADFACRLCGNLETRGVPVTTLVLMESTLGTAVPANVELCINLYESRPATDWLPVFRGIPVEALGPNTEVMNLDVNANEELQWLTSYNHFTIASGSEMKVMLRNLLVLRQSQFQQQLQQQVQASQQRLQPAQSPIQPLQPQQAQFPSRPIPQRLAAHGADAIPVNSTSRVKLANREVPASPVVHTR